MAVNARAEEQTLLLVDPPQHGLLAGFSTGLVALAGYLSRHAPEINVELHDFGPTPLRDVEGEVERALRDRNGRPFVGITTTTATYQAALRCAEVFKRNCPECIVIFGGSHASAQDDTILQHHEAVDFVIRGEGEVPLLAFLRSFPAVSSVPGLTSRDGRGYRRNDPPPLLGQEDLDRVPIAYEGLGLRSASGKFGHVTYVSARGCPRRCFFCAAGGREVRSKSVEAVLKDLRYLIGTCGFTRIAFEDNFFAHPPERTLELCAAMRELRREMEFRWDCQTRVESLEHDGMIAAMEQAGCEAVYLGVEALHADLLRFLGKTSSPEAYLDTLERVVVSRLLESDVECFLDLQLGIPAEQEEHAQEARARLQRLARMARAAGKTITIFPQLHVLYPGTELFCSARRDGALGPGSEDVFERFTKWEAQHQRVQHWLGRHFAHGTGGIPLGILQQDLLRNRGRFEVDPDAVFLIMDRFDEYERLTGLRVFRYGRFLAGAENRPNSTPSVSGDRGTCCSY